MRLLFFNEGNLGSNILGQAQLEATLRGHATDVAGLQTRFVTLPPQGRLARAAVFKTTRRLSASHLDLGTLRWHAMQSTRTRRALHAEIARWHPDVVHVHTHSIALGLGRAMRSTPVALSVDATIGDWAAMPAWRRTDRVERLELGPTLAAESRAFRRAAIVVAWTGWAHRSVQEAAPTARVVTLHPGIDLQRFAPAPRRPRPRPRLLFVGGRFVDKGGADLVAALGDRLGRDVELDVVTPADVPPREGLRVHRLGPGDPELIDLREQADLLCLPSGADAAPWAVLEAMASGTPVVASTVGGIRDLVGDDEAGLLVPFGDRRALREAVLSLVDDPDRRAQLGAAARRRCEERFDAARQTPELLRMLRDLSEQG